MIRRIFIEDLGLGMFVDRYGAGTFDRPLAFPRQNVSSLADIELMREAGVTEVFIDTDKGRDLPPEKLARYENEQTLHPVRVEKRASFSEEVHVAAKAYDECLRYARSFMSAVRAGEPFDHREAEPLVDNLIASVKRNESAAICLTKLRARDDYTYTHCVNVGLMAVIFGLHLGMDEEELARLGKAGLFHDVGKARLPEQLLVKPSKLTAAEYRIAQLHSLEGYKVMKRQPEMHPEVLRAIYEHHERFDGSGYPRSIAGKYMSNFARILAVVDVYDAMTSKRPYAKPKTASEAFRLMYAARGKDFEPQYVERFIKSLGIYPVGSFVRLTNGRFAVVCESNFEKPLHPTVRVVYDHKLRQRHGEVINLAEHAASQDFALEVAECLDPRPLKIDVMRLMC